MIIFINCCNLLKSLYFYIFLYQCRVNAISLNRQIFYQTCINVDLLFTAEMFYRFNANKCQIDQRLNCQNAKLIKCQVDLRLNGPNAKLSKCQFDQWLNGLNAKLIKCQVDLKLNGQNAKLT
jgi:hypothetical protein